MFTIWSVRDDQLKYRKTWTSKTIIKEPNFASVRNSSSVIWFKFLELIMTSHETSIQLASKYVAKYEVEIFHFFRQEEIRDSTIGQ